jgi:hypothetical protein
MPCSSKWSHASRFPNQNPVHIFLLPHMCYMFHPPRPQIDLHVRGSVHHSTIHKEKSNKMQQCIKIFIIPYLYEAQHVSGDTRPIIRSLKLHWQPLVFHTWKVVGRVIGGRCQAQSTCPTTLHVCKTRGCQCSFRFLMMGGVSPETC